MRVVTQLPAVPSVARTPCSAGRRESSNSAADSVFSAGRGGGPDAESPFSPVDGTLNGGDAAAATTLVLETEGLSLPVPPAVAELRHHHQDVQPARR